MRLLTLTGCVPCMQVKQQMIAEDIQVDIFNLSVRSLEATRIKKLLAAQNVRALPILFNDSDVAIASGPDQVRAALFPKRKV